MIYLPSYDYDIEWGIPIILLIDVLHNGATLEDFDSSKYCPICGQPRAKCLCDPGDSLLTCHICRDRYTTNQDGICDSCKRQQWLDEHA